VVNERGGGKRYIAETGNRQENEKTNNRRTVIPKQR